jgi:probable rRNA maturation factor
MTTTRRKADDIDDRVEFVMDSELWSKYPDAEATIRKAVAQAAHVSTQMHGDVAVVLTDDAAMHALNKRWRGQDKPTNVLSFPTQACARGEEPAHLGDIVIAFETTAAEAEREAKPFAHHLAHLAVHGYLHLIGYDHETERDAETMEQLETKILAHIGVPDPYASDEAATLNSHA